MEIAEQFNTHDITDYDFMFSSGSKLIVSIDHDAGDVAKELDDRYIMNIAAKPAITDPEEKVDAEDIVIFKTTLAFVAVRHRKQRMPTVEELLEMKKFTHKLAKLVQ